MTVASYPCLLTQTAIAEILSDMNAEIAALEAKLAKACQVKQVMMSMLLTGRVRLVESGNPSDMDADVTALEGKLSKAREVKQGMMQELLTRRVRLV